MNFSFLIPSRNGVEFLEWAYKSIRKNQGKHIVEIIVLDDNSDKDNTWEWCEQTRKTDLKFKAFRNEGPNQYGISSGYKFLSNHATEDIICHWHNDMFLTDGTLDLVEFYLKDVEFAGQNVVSLTRIEPPIYGPGPEKVIWKNGPVELSEWDEDKFLKFLPQAAAEWNYGPTCGHFAPFFMYRDRYLELGGNDTKYFPLQAREDSDWAFRLILAGHGTVQIPAFVYHFASRGNRRSKHETDSYTDNPAWEQININSTRNFIRKWQTMQLHDEYLTPTPPKRYDIGFVIKNCTYNLLYNLEPWCDTLICDLDEHQLNRYVELHQRETPVRLDDKLLRSKSRRIPNIIVEMNGRELTHDDFAYIQNLSAIINDSGQIGEMQIGNLRLNIKSMESYEQNLIVCKNEKPY